MYKPILVMPLCMSRGMYLSADIRAEIRVEMRADIRAEMRAEYKGVEIGCCTSVVVHYTSEESTNITRC